MKQAMLMISLLAIVVPAGARADGPPDDSHATAEWTVFLYVAADRGGEDAMFRAEMERWMRHGSTPRVRVVALYDRPPDAYGAIGGIPEWKGAKLVHVDPGKLTEVKEWSEAEVNTGSPETLARFLQVARAHCPSRRSLFFGIGHGVGLLGTFADATVPDPPVSNPNLETTEWAAAVAEPPTFDLIVLESCYMSSLELAHALRPHSRWLVASQNFAWTETYPVERMLRLLNEDPCIDAGLVGKLLVDGYRPGETRATSVSALIDLVHLRTLESAVSALGRALSGALSTTCQRARFERDLSKVFEITDTALCDPNFRGMRDVGQLADVLTRWKSPAVRDAAAEVRRACGGCVVSIGSSGNPLRLSGLSLDVFPCTAIPKCEDYEALPSSASSCWDEFLAELARGGCGACIDVSSDGPCVEGDIRRGPIRVHADFSGIDTWCGRIDFVAGTAGTVLVRTPCTPSEAGRACATWDGTYLELAAGHQGVPLVPYAVREVGPGAVAGFTAARVEGNDWQSSSGYTVFVDYLSESDRWHGVRDRLIGYLAYQGTVPHPERATLRRLRAGSRIRPLITLVRGSNGVLEREPKAESRAALVLDEDEGLHLLRARGVGAWFVGFEAYRNDGSLLKQWLWPHPIDLPPP